MQLTTHTRTHCSSVYRTPIAVAVGDPSHVFTLTPILQLHTAAVKPHTTGWDGQPNTQMRVLYPSPSCPSQRNYQPPTRPDVMTSGEQVQFNPWSWLKLDLYSNELFTKVKRGVLPTQNTVSGILWLKLKGHTEFIRHSEAIHAVLLGFLLLRQNTDPRQLGGGKGLYGLHLPGHS